MTIQNATVTLYVQNDNELEFYKLLKLVDTLPPEQPFKIDSFKDVFVSKYNDDIRNNTTINIPIELYVKFNIYYQFNKGYKIR